MIMGLTYEQEKDRLRTRITDMIKAGEVIKITSGLYQYNFKYRVRKNTIFPVSWRFVRTQKPGWSINYVCQLTGRTGDIACRAYTITRSIRRGNAIFPANRCRYWWS
jgi:hypothetical protein